jgi:hypothetical protein
MEKENKHERNHVTGGKDKNQKNKYEENSYTREKMTPLTDHLLVKMNFYLIGRFQVKVIFFLIDHSEVTLIPFLIDHFDMQFLTLQVKI